MASVNKVIILGNLGRDPEARYLPSGECVCNISVATTERWKDKQSGEQMEHTEWHRVNFFGRLAEVVRDYLKKGSMIYVEGSLRTRSYEHEGVTKYSTEIRADEMKMLGPKPEGGGQERRPEGQQSQGRNGYADARGRGQPAQRPAGNAGSKPASGFDDMDDDIPF